MSDHQRNLIRHRLKELRMDLPIPQQESYSRRIIRQIYQQNFYRQSKHIALYMSVNGEVCLARLWKTASAHGKYCYFPVLNEGKLAFYHATPSTAFKKNLYGILEPDTEKTHQVSIDELDVVFMPLVSFDQFGHRLGMGKGYYDKTFASILEGANEHIDVYGVAYECQRYPLLPAKPWDVPLDGVITEERIYWSKS